MADQAPFSLLLKGASFVAQGILPYVKGDKNGEN